jgi:hypothetical protein
VSHITWANLLGKRTKAITETLNILDNKEEWDDQERKDRILESLEDLIQERYHALAAELIAQRDSIVQGWKDELEKLDRSNPQ